MVDKDQLDQGQPDDESDNMAQLEYEIKKLLDALRREEASSSLKVNQNGSGSQAKIKLFIQEYKKYVVIKDLLEAPPRKYSIQRIIYRFTYGRKRSKKNIRDLEQFIEDTLKDLSKNPSSVGEDRIDQAIDDCDTLRGLAPEVMVDKLMNRRRTPTVIAFAVIFIAALFLIFHICGGPRVGIVTDAKFVAAVMTAILSIGTFTVNLEKDVISSLNNDQQDSIKSSQKYLSHLLNHRTVNAISIIVLLVAAVIALV